MNRPRTLTWLRSFWTASLTVAMVLIAPIAWCDPRGVVLIDPEPRVLAAVDVALSPWGLHVMRAPPPAPEGDIVAASAQAQAIAAAQYAGAVIWVAKPQGAGSPSLWVYDAQTEQLAVRPLNVTSPFDDAGAAAVALSVKTILRSSPLVQVKEGPPPEPPPPAAPAAPVRVQVPAPSAVEPRSPLDTRSTWRLEILAGARAPTDAQDADPRGALGVSMWPEALRGKGGVGALVHFGLPITVGSEGRRVTADFSQLSVALSARARATLAWLSFELDAGPSLRAAWLDGNIPRTQLHSFQVYPAMDVAGVVDAKVGPHLGLGAFVYTSSLFFFPRYSYTSPGGGKTILYSEPPVDVLVGVRLTVGVD